MKWYRKAADQGLAGAQALLGAMYAEGTAVPQNYGEAMKWYRKAAHQGEAFAQASLGFMYEHGKGVTQNYGEALRWYRKAAEQGDADVQIILTRLTGSRPIGWMTGRPGPNTRRLLVEAGGFLYDRDSLADELPYWLMIDAKPHLVIPYSYEANDNRFNQNSGFSTGEHFFTYMRDAFDLLHREGRAGSPKLLSIGLHDRLIGRPGRCAGLIKLLEYMRGFDDVWFCAGADIAHHWQRGFPPSVDRNREK